jgi:two-component sensor histidine kinase
MHMRVPLLSDRKRVGTRETSVPLGGSEIGLAIRRGRISIRLILSLLMAAIIIPSIVFGVLLLQRNNQAQQEMVTTLAEATASSISEALDRQVAGMLTTLRVLSTSRALDGSDLTDFYSRADLALEGSEAHLIVTDSEFNQLINTRVPHGAALGKIADIETATRALETGSPAISNTFFGETARRWVVNVILPLAPAPRPARLLILTHDVDQLSSALGNRNISGGWNAVIVDRNRTVLTSSEESVPVGQPFFLAASLDPIRSTVRQSVTFEGNSYALIRSISNLSGWETIVWAPDAVVQAPLRRSLRTLALGGVAIIMIGVVLAWLLSRQIATPIRRLARDALSLGAGKSVEAMDYPVAEIARVSQALAQASVDRLAHENEIRFLMREVAHRSKNQLTVVSSIAKQTARHARTFAGFQDSFQKRIQGLARSTDLLIAGGVAGVELRELIDAQLEPFRPSQATRVEISGAPFRLSNQAAQTLGLALHELATNAAKYGAFSMADGRLTVSWKVQSDKLDLVWRELVPLLRKRTRVTGFGTEVIERMLGGALAAKIDRVIHRNGLEYRFSIPLDRVAREQNEADETAAGG